MFIPFKNFLLWLALLVLAACSSNNESLTDTTAPDVIYGRAKNSINVGDFQTAISFFEELESRYPFSEYALQAQLDLLYAYYKFGESGSAIALADRFARFNPAHPNLDYTIYMKGVVQQDDRKGLFDKWNKQAREDFDVFNLKEAFATFNELIRRFPESQYAADAQKRMTYIRNTLAKNELQTAEFYMGRYQYVAAANRAKIVIQQFPETQASRDALKTLKAAYLALGLNDLAENVDQIIAIN